MGGDGTQANPFRAMHDVTPYKPSDQESWRNTAFDDDFIYWRAGTFALKGNIDVNPDPCLRLLEWRGNCKAQAWLVCPDETEISITCGGGGDQRGGIRFARW